MEKELRSGPLKFYKGLGAVQFTVLPPRWDDKGYMSKQGAILLEAAPSSGRQQWDWDQKITFAISITDICNLVDMDPAKRRIFHDHQDTPKVLEFQAGEGDYENTYMMNLSEGKGSGRRTVRVPFSSGEYQILMRLLVQVSPLMIGWTDNVVEAQAQRRNS